MNVKVVGIKRRKDKDKVLRLTKPNGGYSFNTFSLKNKAKKPNKNIIIPFKLLNLLVL